MLQVGFDPGKELPRGRHEPLGRQDASVNAKGEQVGRDALKEPPPVRLEHLGLPLRQADLRVMKRQPLKLHGEGLDLVGFGARQKRLALSPQGVGARLLKQDPGRSRLKQCHSRLIGLRLDC